MFEKNTVFVIGAGASHELGYPLGAELPRLVVQKASELQKFCRSSGFSIQMPRIVEARIDDREPQNRIVRAWNSVADDCKQIMARLQDAGPVVIDHFLHDNPKLQSIGRTLIAWVILEKEALAFDAFQNRDESHDINRKNWVSLIASELSFQSNGNTLRNNRVKFITFNYDLSLERLLGRALSSREIFDDAAVRDFFNNNRVLHVYGCLRLDSFATAPPIGYPYDDILKKVDLAFEAGQDLLLIDPDEKTARISIFEMAKEALLDAEDIYVLGYGFDRSNNLRLGFPETIYSERRPNPKNLYFTNYKDKPAINRRLNGIFRLPRRALLDKDHDEGAGLNSSSCAFHKSRKGVFESLMDDFNLGSE